MLEKLCLWLNLIQVFAQVFGVDEHSKMQNFRAILRYMYIDKIIKKSTNSWCMRYSIIYFNNSHFYHIYLTSKFDISVRFNIKVWFWQKFPKAKSCHHDTDQMLQSIVVKFLHNLYTDEFSVGLLYFGHGRVVRSSNTCMQKIGLGLEKLFLWLDSVQISTVV